MPFATKQERQSRLRERPESQVELRPPFLGRAALMASPARVVLTLFFGRRAPLRHGPFHHRSDPLAHHPRCCRAICAARWIAMTVSAAVRMWACCA